MTLLHTFPSGVPRGYQLVTADGATGGDSITSQPRDRTTRRLVVRSVVRMAVGIVVLFGLYALAPLGQRTMGSVLAGLVVSVLLLVMVVTWQIVAVTRSPSPVLRAVEGLALSVPLLLLLFACIYFVTGKTDPGSFTEPLTRVDAFYFSTTVFATVGFGDIAAASQTARGLVSAQMLADLVLIGVIAKVLVGAAQRRRGALDADRDRPGPSGAREP